MTKPKTDPKPLPNTDLKAESPESIRRRRIISIIAIAVLIGLMIALYFVAREPLEQLKDNPDAFRDWIYAQGFWGPVVFFLLMVAQIIVAVIPAGPIELAAGYIFGIWGGTGLCLAGGVVGGAIVFFLVKRFGYKLITAFISQEKINSLRFLQNSKKLNFFVFLFFFIPGAPKDVLTYFVPLTPMKFKDFIWISNVARIPTFLLSVAGGASLGEEYYIIGAVLIGVSLLAGAIGMIIFGKIEAKENKALEEKTSLKEKTSQPQQ